MAGKGTRAEQAARRAERMAELQLLRELGFSMEEIAEQSGLAVSTVRNMFSDPSGERRREQVRRLQKEPCPRCGRPKSAQPGGASGDVPRVCIVCAREELPARRRWTRETVIEAIQLWAARHGGVAPSARDFTRPVSVKGAEYPPLGCVYQSPSWRAKCLARGVRLVDAPFDSWSEALEEAGFEPRAQGHWKDTEAQKRVLGALARERWAAYKRGEALPPGFGGPHAGKVRPAALAMLAAGKALTIGELSLETGCSYSHAALVLRQLYREGLVERLNLEGYAVYLAVEEAA